MPKQLPTQRKQKSVKKLLNINFMEQQQTLKQSTIKLIDYYENFERQIQEDSIRITKQLHCQFNRTNEIIEQIEKQRLILKDMGKRIKEEDQKYLVLGEEKKQMINKASGYQAQLALDIQQAKIKKQQTGKKINNLKQKIFQAKNHDNLIQQEIKFHNLKIKQKRAERTQILDGIKNIRKKFDQSEFLKKKLNNQLQQMRGNIRVYCRIRPFSKNSTKQPNFEVLNDTKLVIKIPTDSRKSDNYQKDYAFYFQQIFDQHQKQSSIFNELAQLIQSSIDGKNVCIFAYGQTGSGKTFTMQGEKTEELKGIIPRSINLIFDEINKAKEFNWEYTVLVSIRQVYLESVRDLLDQKNNQDQYTEFQAKNIQQVEILMDRARNTRKVAQTKCNERSSRSHLIFTLKINAYNKQTNKIRNGSLTLIDLAGSERMNISKVQGQRLKQTQSINKSLSHLADVISALNKKQAHIPYRNSKLTYVLQNVLSGNSKTLMFVNISPDENDFNVTLCSLRFAEKVKECRLSGKQK